MAPTRVGAGGGVAPASDRRDSRPLLEKYRHYLELLARLQIGRRLQGKVDAADLVQETFLEAYRHLPRFQGTTEAELTQWLRAILAALVAKLVRRYLGTQRRNARLERELEEELDRSSGSLVKALLDPESTPSKQAMSKEAAVRLANALAELPAHYREVIILRHLEGLSFPDVARRMKRKLDSVKNLWARALARLRDRRGGVS